MSLSFQLLCTNSLVSVLLFIIEKVLKAPFSHLPPLHLLHFSQGQHSFICSLPLCLFPSLSLHLSQWIFYTCDDWVREHFTSHVITRSSTSPFAPPNCSSPPSYTILPTSIQLEPKKSPLPPPHLPITKNSPGVFMEANTKDIFTKINKTLRCADYFTPFQWKWN